MKKSIAAFLLLFLISNCVMAQNTATLIYIDQYKDIAIKEMKRTGIPASITLAQGIIESNSGQSNLALNFKNHFGIKCKSDWKGETTYQDDDTKQECFRVYATAARSFIDHSDFLKNRPNYAPLFELDPVDDSAWAYGLKKAGYATAPDYPKKLLKVIADFELSQYNFPELAKEDSIVANNIATPAKDANQLVKLDSLKTSKSVDTIKAKEILSIKKEATSNINKDSVVEPIDTVQLSKVKGLTSIEKVTNSIPTAIQTIEMLKTESVKDTVRVADTINKAVNKQLINYPSVRFRINDIPVIWAKAGSSYLAIANAQNVPLYRLFEYNEIQEADLLPNDQLVFLAAKKKEIAKKVHTVKANENLYGISQAEGIQLKYLKQFNPKTSDDNLKEGDFLFLFPPFDAPKKSNPIIDAFKPIEPKNNTPSTKINSKTISHTSTKKDTSTDLKNTEASKNKISILKKLNPFNKKNQ
jgi:LysM repeat protein